MSEGVTVTVAFAVKPQLADKFVGSLRRMFPVTRQRPGFQSIRLLRSQIDPNQFVLIEEWDEARNFHDYAQFRTETGDTAELMAMTIDSPQVAIYSQGPLAAAHA